MKTLFPEMEREILEDRKAERREQVQRARERLSKSDFTWIINYMLDQGPVTEHTAMIEAPRGSSAVESISVGLNVLMCLNDLWMVRKLWRKPMGIHPGSGERSYLYGIRGVHPIDQSAANTPTEDL